MGWKSVPDTDLRAWILEENNEERELIVEALVPARKVRFKKWAGTSRAPESIESEPGDRARILCELRDYLESEVDLRTTLLKAAGAIAIRATGRQVRRFVEHPLVKAIRPNRRLR